ncbi:MAG: phosphoesterase PA-phosphatase related protein [Ilumatobacteraceae bacterium]|nr:phosphoesterase PA-phosphatase related protein [Ilumatobacteraceae bacterium]
MPDDDAMRIRRRRLLVVAAVSVVVVAVVYVIAIRTHVGQRIDGVAFRRRSAVTATTTRRTDRLLGTVSVASLIGFGGAIVLIGLARRRISLAVAAGVAMAGAVVTTEVLKKRILTRPELGVFGGVHYNTYPSGHATIGMALSLGAVMVAPVSLRRIAGVGAALISTAFGTAVLSSGWHRPSDTIGAYFVTLAWFATSAALVAERDHRDAARIAAAPEPRPSPPLLIAAAVGVLGILMFVLWKSLSATGLHTVVYAAPYVAACAGIDLAGVAVVGTFYVLQRTRPRPARPPRPRG